MKTLNTISLILVIIGGINWGLVGLFDFNLVSALFGTFSAMTRVIYCLIGIASLFSISLLLRDRSTSTR
ncbi:DUF378 domain-containing protein [Clostridium chromiireducens]|uniref:DUF378 domain-containing protein n=1 Tax=Clostridium chromiireducens TaxID=225345 RepID=A0A399IPH4_9CLOT|nr:DUF378 domain-containing protein [Clostridium chromiireducens]RII34943.1 DUF378 domain-containing protein [Clostridium chromiireducens]